MAMIYRINAGRIPLKSELGWVHDPQSGGGRIVGEACHFVDTLQAICGERPVSVSAFGVNPHRADLAGDDIVTMTVAFDRGSLGTIHYFANGGKSYPKERIEIFCQERLAVLDNFRKLELADNDRVRVTRTLNANKGFTEEAQAFLRCCREGSSPTSLESLIDTTRVTLAAMDGLKQSET